MKTIQSCDLVEFHDSQCALITIAGRGVEMIFRRVSLYLPDAATKESYGVHSADVAVRLTSLMGLSMLQPLPDDAWVLDVGIQGADGTPLDIGKDIPIDGFSVRSFAITFNNGALLTFLAERLRIE